MIKGVGRAEDLFSRISSLGEQAIDAFIADRQSEELFLDFKRSADGGAGTRLAVRDRENLGKAISGFGNSEGGILVWGVDCRPDQQLGDVAAAKVRIENPGRFKSWLENAISGLTIPPHPDVRHLSVESTIAGSGFVATHIPKSYLAPHQCIRPMQYYMRVGSNFEPIPHGVLAGMFGRYPQAVVFHMWTAPPAEITPAGGAHFEVGLLVTNRSPTMARDVYLNVTVFPPGRVSRVAVAFPDLLNWSGNQMFGCITQVVTRDNYKLAPNAIIQPLVLTFDLIPPFAQGLHLKIALGCSGAPIKEFRHDVQPVRLQNLYDSFLNNYESEDARREFVKEIVGGRKDGDTAAIYDETRGH